jgi:hypothetical protein
MAINGSAIEAAIAHFDAQGTRNMMVPEWGELVVYWTPLTLFEKRKIFPSGRAIEQTVAADVLIHKAMDKDGKPLFSLADREKLMRQADQSIVERIAARILGGASSDFGDAVESAEKN